MAANNKDASFVIAFRMILWLYVVYGLNILSASAIMERSL